MSFHVIDRHDWYVPSFREFLRKRNACPEAGLEPGADGDGDCVDRCSRMLSQNLVEQMGEVFRVLALCYCRINAAVLRVDRLRTHGISKHRESEVGAKLSVCFDERDTGIVRRGFYA